METDRKEGLCQGKTTEAETPTGTLPPVEEKPSGENVRPME